MAIEPFRPSSIPCLVVISMTIHGLFLLDGVHAVADPIPDPVAILRAVEKARMALPPMRIAMEMEYRSDRVQNRTTLEIDFAGDRRRFRGTRDVGSEFCTIFDGKQVLVYRKDAESAVIRDPADSTADTCFDPRILGIDRSFSWRSTVESSLAYRNSDEVTLVGREEIDNVPVFRLRLVDALGQQRDFWIADREGYPVYRFAYEVGGVREVVTSQYAEAERGGHAVLPVRVECKHYIRGNLASSRIVKIRAVELDMPIPAETWTLVGLGLPVGTPVSDLRIKRRIGYWDGNRLVEDWLGGVQGDDSVTEVATARHLPFAEPVWRGRLLVVLVIVAGLAVIGFAALRFTFRHPANK